MTFEAHRAAIVARFNSEWTSQGTTSGLFPVEHENRPLPAQRGTWCRFSVRFGERANASVGTEHQRTTGVVYLQIFTKEGSGTKDARTAAELLAQAFDNRQLAVQAPHPGSLDFDVTNLTTVGKTGDGWHQSNATVTFRAEAFQDRRTDELIVDGELILY